MRASTLFIVTLLVFAVGAAQAQPKPEGFAVKKIATGASYAVNQNDTSSGYPIAGSSMIAHYLYYADSAVVYRYIDYSADNTTWSVISTDTITATAAGSSELSIRSGNAEKSALLYGWLRTRLAWKANSGVTTPTYRNWIFYKK